MQFPVRATPKLYRFLLDRPLMNYSSLNELRIKLRDWDSKRILCFLRLRFFKYLLRLVDRRRICAFNSFAFAQLAPSVAYAYSPSEYGFVMAVLRLFIDTKDAASSSIGLAFGDFAGASVGGRGIDGDLSPRKTGLGLNFAATFLSVVIPSGTSALRSFG